VSPEDSVVVVLARLVARGLVLMSTGASAPRRCTISGMSTKMLESRPLVDDPEEVCEPISNNASQAAIFRC